MTRGPGFDLNNIDIDQPLNISFRIINAYVVAFDGQATRIDVKIGDNQYTVALHSTLPALPKAGDPIHKGDLITPKAGVDGCMNVKVNKKVLIEALKELVTDMENDNG